MRKLAWALVWFGISGCPSDHKPKPDAGAADGGGRDSAAAAEAGAGGGAQAGSSGNTSGAGAAANGGSSGGGAGGSTGAGAASGGRAGSSGTGGNSGQSGSGGSAGAPAPSGSTMIVGVGSSAFRGWSSDGATWAYCGDPSGADHAPRLLRNIGYGDGVFIAAGGDANGMVMRSLDAIHWQEDLHPTNACPGDGYPSSCTNWMGAVAFHAGTWLAAGGNGAIMRSTDGGTTWNGLKSKFAEGRMRTMGAGSGRFLAGADVGDHPGADGAIVWVSADNGDTWAKTTPWTNAPMNAYLEFAHGAGTFIAFAPADVDARACFVSTNAGDTWEACAASVKSNLSFVYDGSQWVTPASGGYATSPDGKTWTTHTASNVPTLLLFDGKTWFGRSGGTIYRGATLDSFAKVGMNVPEFRGWAIGQVLDKNLPVTGVPACEDNR